MGQAHVQPADHAGPGGPELGDICCYRLSGEEAVSKPGSAGILPADSAARMAALPGFETAFKSRIMLSLHGVRLSPGTNAATCWAISPARSRQLSSSRSRTRIRRHCRYRLPQHSSAWIDISRLPLKQRARRETGTICLSAHSLMPPAAARRKSM